MAAAPRPRPSLRGQEIASGRRNIWQIMLSHTVNIPPSYHLYGLVTPAQRFLYMREDGNYEMYDRNWHGRYEAGRRIV
jgi:hypothetical protein